jgi:hypothetical protein
MKEITEQKLNKYFTITEKAIAAVKIAVPENSELYKTAKDFMDMAVRYFHDAKHFKEKGNYVDAFAAINYAHAWLDAGARMKLFDVGSEGGKLFASD